jgi:cell wall-associated NlpC family hydrolase
MDTTLQATQPVDQGAVVRALVQQARAARVDPVTLIAAGLEESNLDPRATGDSNSSYGIFQLHKGGALGRLTPDQAYDPATNAGVAARGWASVGGSQYTQPGRESLMHYFSKFGRGASNEIPTQRALALLPRAQQLYAQYADGATTPTTKPVKPVAPAQPAAPPVDEREASLRGQFAALMKGGKVRPIDILTGGMQAVDAAAAQNAQRAADLARQAADEEQDTNPVPPTTPTATGGANPPAPNSQGVTRATSWALNNLGIPYSWGGGTPAGPSRGIARGAGTTGYDCSAFVQAALAQAGVKLPRTTYDQIKMGQAVGSLAQAQPGDLIFPSTGHVGIYLGNGQMAEAPYTGAVTRVKNVTGMRPVAIRRVL